MPRKFDDAKKKEWLELYENGKSDKWIANHAKCDLRTVRKAINDARLKRDVVVARIELVKDALRRHQDSLLEELDRIISGLTVVQKDFAVLSWHRGKDSVFNEPDDQPKLESGAESTMRRLLKEHLKNDKLWRVLAQWEKANANYLAARAVLQLKTAVLLQEKTGYKMVDKFDSPPFIWSYTAGPLLYKTATDMAFTLPEEGNLKKAISKMDAAISVNTDNGHVSFDNHSVLAEAPGNEQKTKHNLLDAFKDLAASPELKVVRETYQALEQMTARARQVVEGVRLLGLVPGQCEICRRLGM